MKMSFLVFVAIIGAHVIGIVVGSGGALIRANEVGAYQACKDLKVPLLNCEELQ